MSIDEGQMIDSIMLDLRKAFDLVNHDILLQKLRLYKVSEDSLKWFTSYLKMRKQYVYLNECKSSLKYIQSGVPQGSILGPLLCILFINEFGLHMKYCNADMYADDTTFYSSGHNVSELNSKLNDEMKIISDWCDANKMVINTKKTQCMLVQ